MIKLDNRSIEVCPIKLYSVEDVARIEGVPAGTVRMAIARMNNHGVSVHWRGYQFVQLGLRMWVGLDKDVPVQLAS